MALVLTYLCATAHWLTALCITVNLLIIFASQEECDRVDIKTLTCTFIPREIPYGISSVSILDFKKLNENFDVNSSYFRSDHWARIKSIVLASNESDNQSFLNLRQKSFDGLKSLEQLNIHIKTAINLDLDTFTGLDTLKLLDMSGCVRLSLNELVPSLNGKRKLPSLEILKLSELNFYKGPISIDTNFAKALEDKNVTTLDISHTRMTNFNATALCKYMKHLTNINISFSTVAHMTAEKSIDVCRCLQHLQVLDYSYVPYFLVIPSVKYFNMTWYSSDLNTQLILAPNIVNYSTVVPLSASFWIMNSTVKLNSPLQWRSQEVIIRHNNIKYLDVTMHCGNYTVFAFKHFDLAKNGLEFLHPSILACFPNLEKLDLSSNQLFKMVQENRLLFEQLLFSLRHLKLIVLSTNFLKNIPANIFIQNYDLEKIDLSNNEIEQVTFTLQHLKKLKVLDLQYNRIKILNEISLNLLDSVNTDMKAMVQLHSNPISCSRCEAKKFLHWLTSTKSVIIPVAHLSCIAEDGSLKYISLQTLDLVQGICNKKTIIISASTSVGVIALTAVVIVTIVYKLRKWATDKTKRMKFLNKLQEGEGQYEFVAFLSHSSDDKDFVDNYLIDKLNENLQLLTGIDRCLVCTGDLYMRPGFLILDETAQCIERASAFIVVVSDSYCTSTYCSNEVDHAYRLNKPIILMMKGHVDENLMMPTMKLLFKSNVRVLWTFENNEHVLKTTWEKVCTSVLDLATQNEST